MVQIVYSSSFSSCFIFGRFIEVVRYATSFTLDSFFITSKTQRTSKELHGKEWQSKSSSNLQQAQSNLKLGCVYGLQIGLLPTHLSLKSSFSVASVLQLCYEFIKVFFPDVWPDYRQHFWNPLQFPLQEKTLKIPNRKSNHYTIFHWSTIKTPLDAYRGKFSCQHYYQWFNFSTKDFRTRLLSEQFCLDFPCNQFMGLLGSPEINAFCLHYQFTFHVLNKESAVRKQILSMFENKIGSLGKRVEWELLSFSIVSWW